MKMLSKVVLPLCFLASTNWANAELPADYKVKLLTENFPPFNMTEIGNHFAKGDEIKGINTDIVREIFKRANIGYDLELRYPWSLIYQFVESTPNSAIFSTDLTTDRRPQFKWVGPLSGTAIVLVTKNDSGLEVNKLSDAKNYRVGAYNDAAPAKFLEKHDVSYSGSQSDDICLEKLVDNEIDIWATNDPIFQYIAKRNSVTGLQVALFLENRDQYIALNKETPDEVVQRLQNALDSVRNDGTADKIKKKYIDTRKKTTSPEKQATAEPL